MLMGGPPRCSRLSSTTPSRLPLAEPRRRQICGPRSVRLSWVPTRRINSKITCTTSSAQAGSRCRTHSKRSRPTGSLRIARRGCRNAPAACAPTPSLVADRFSRGRVSNGTNLVVFAISPRVMRGCVAGGGPSGGARHRFAARKGIPLRAFENNQFRSVAKATPTTVVVRGQVWRAACWTSCTREVSPSLV